jgi:hypothetical protein
MKSTAGPAILFILLVALPAASRADEPGVPAFEFLVKIDDSSRTVDPERPASDGVAIEHPAAHASGGAGPATIFGAIGLAGIGLGAALRILLRRV